jgi:hypothetical protein
MLDLHEGFLEDEASGGVFRVYAAVEFVVVGFEVIAEQGQSEAAASLERSVAGAAVAAELSEERCDVFLEIGCFVVGLCGVALRDGWELGRVVAGLGVRGVERGCGESGGGQQSSESHEFSFRATMGSVEFWVI